MAKRGHGRRPKPLHNRDNHLLQNDRSDNPRQPLAVEKILHAILHKIRRHVHSQIYPEHLQVQTDQHGRRRTATTRHAHAKNGFTESAVDCVANKPASSGVIHESRNQGNDQGRDDLKGGDDAIGAEQGVC